MEIYIWNKRLKSIILNIFTNHTLSQLLYFVISISGIKFYIELILVDGTAFLKEAKNKHNDEFIY